LDLNGIPGHGSGYHGPPPAGRGNSQGAIQPDTKHLHQRLPPEALDAKVNSMTGKINFPINVALFGGIPTPKHILVAQHCVRLKWLVFPRCIANKPSNCCKTRGEGHAVELQQACSSCCTRG